MSRIETGPALERLRALREALPTGVEALIDREVKDTLQATAVQLVPKRTGNLANLLASADAIQKTRTDSGIRWTFGFVTDAMQKAGFYAFWVEFGTKGYAAGDRREAGVDRKGRRRVRKVTRATGPHRAVPFLRPAWLAFRAAVGRLNGVIQASGGDVTISTKLRE
jgi:hypothetical protein